MVYGFKPAELLALTEPQFWGYADRADAVLSLQAQHQAVELSKILIPLLGVKPR